MKKISPPKAITHYIFNTSTGKGVAVSIVDVFMERSPQGAITITDTVTDTFYTTQSIRAVTAIEAAKFINGRFDPFGHYEDDDNGQEQEEEDK